MKLTVFLMTAACLNVAATGISQSVTFSGKNVPLKAIFSVVKQQTGYLFVYQENTLNGTKPVTVQALNKPLLQFLDSVLKNQPLRYSVIGKKTINIFPSVDMSSDRQPNSPGTNEYNNGGENFPPPVLIRGIVRDSLNNPLSGATIMHYTNKTTVSTDADGSFSIRVSEGDVLIFSYIGFESREVKITSDMLKDPAAKTFNIFLRPVDAKLDEVVVNAGYYTVKDRERTGSISRITSKEIEKQPVLNPLQALQGRVPSVEIIQQTGVPGGGFKVQIRGRSSINANNSNDPLYIIDGVPFPSSGVSASASTGIFGSSGASPLSLINPQDILSIEILKDADATSIYGSRGANGVILLTTKKGLGNTTAISAIYSQGISHVGNKLKLLNTGQYLQMRNEAFENDGLSPTEMDYDVNGSWDKNKYTDWQKNLIGNQASVTNASLSASGGNRKNTYLIGANYYKEGTVFPGSYGFNRTSLHSALNIGSSEDRFNINFSGNFSHNTSELLRGDLTTLILLAPNAPDPYDQYGQLNWGKDSTVYLNPMASLLRTNNAITDNLTGNVLASFKILKTLTLKTSIGYTNIKRSELGKSPLASVPPGFFPTSADRSSNFSDNFNNSFIAEPQIDYFIEIGPGKINFLGGLSFQKNKLQLRTLTASNFNSDDLMENIASASTIRTSQMLDAEYRYTAVFARINYSLKDRYIINMTGRRDGSSRFGKGRQFANFGAIGTTWVFTDEEFLKDNLTFLSFGKLRASYGVTGNDQIGDYGYLQLWTSSGSYQGINTIRPSGGIANPDYRWETTRKSEAAIQLGFLKDKFNIELAWYQNRTSNQLINNTLPLSVGSGSIKVNFPALVQNSGWELSSNLNIVENDDWNWSTSINLTIPKNKLVSYPGGLENSQYSNDYLLGQPLTIKKIYNVRGIDPQTGLYDIEDYNGNGSYDNGDRYKYKFIGQYYYGGISNSIKFKDFSLDFLFSFSKQNGFDYITGAFAPGYGDIYSPLSNQPLAVFNKLNGNSDGSIQRFSTLNSANQRFLIARENGGVAINDASYIRLKNAALSYSLNKIFLNRLGINKAMLSIQGQNLLTFTKYIGLDPESQSMGNLPPLRTIALGLNVTF